MFAPNPPVDPYVSPLFRGYVSSPSRNEGWTRLGEHFIVQGLVCAGLLLARAGLCRVVPGKGLSLQGCSWQGLVSTTPGKGWPLQGLWKSCEGIALQIPHKKDIRLEVLFRSLVRELHCKSPLACFWHASGGLLERSWRASGMHLACRQRASCVLLARCLSAPGVLLARSWCASGVPIACSWPASCVLFASCLRDPDVLLACFWYAPGFLLACCWHASDMLVVCFWRAASVRVACCWQAA